MKHLKTALIILILCLSFILMAASGKPQAIMIAIGPLIVAILTPLFSRLFKKAGIEINNALIDTVLIKLIEIIAEIENTQAKGSEKKTLAARIAVQTLTNDEIKLLKTKYGSIETAIQAAYEKSQTAQKGKKT